MGDAAAAAAVEFLLSDSPSVVASASVATDEDVFRMVLERGRIQY